MVFKGRAITAGPAFLNGKCIGNESVVCWLNDHAQVGHYIAAEFEEW